MLDGIASSLSLEPVLEGGQRLVAPAFLHEDLGAAAPDHDEAIAVVVLLERADVGDDLLGEIACLFLPFLTFGPLEPLDVALIEDRRHRLDRFELGPNRSSSERSSTPAVHAAA